MSLVLDNSVLVGWFVPSQATPYTGRVAKRAQREAVMVPALWAAEFVSVMLVLQRRRRIQRHDVAAILARSARLPFTVDREAVAPQDLFALAERHSLSAYDACYLELATRRGLPLATRDASLARAARAAGVLLS